MPSSNPKKKMLFTPPPLISVIQNYRDLIDGVVCINRDTDIDRWESYCARAEGVIDAERLHRLRGVEGVQLPGYGERPWFTERTGARREYWGHGGGCLLSHRNAIRFAQERGWRNVLITEDDAVPEVGEEAARALARALRDLKGKWVLYLGYNTLSASRPFGRALWRQDGYSLWQISGAIALHAYIVPQSMYGAILERLPQEDSQAWSWMARHRAIDNWYRDEVSEWRGVRVYTILPHLYYQEHFYYVHGAARAVDEPVKNVKLSLYPVYPRTCRGLFLLEHVLFAPLRRIAVRVNSLRTYCLCRCFGFRGQKKKKRAKMR